MAKFLLHGVIFADPYLKTEVMDTFIFFCETNSKHTRMVLKLKVKKVLHTVFFYFDLKWKYLIFKKILIFGCKIKGMLVYI